MRLVYLPKHHPKLLSAAYNVDRCAVSFATAALWFLQLGDVEGAIKQCGYVIENILPGYDKNDKVGLYQIFIPLIRVLKWNGQVDKMRNVYEENVPEDIVSHFAVGELHKPISLLLRVCDGSSVKYDNVEADDVGLALTYQPGDFNNRIMACDG